MRQILKNISIWSYFFLALPVFAQMPIEKANISPQVKKWVNKGLKAYERADYDTAELAFRKVLATDPLNAVAAYNLGLTEVELNKNLEAAHFFKKAAKAASDQDLKSKAYFNQGNIWYHKKKYEQAVDAYKNALRNNPEDEEARYNLALAQMKLKKQQKKNRNKKNNKKNKQDQKNQNKNKQNKDWNKKDQNKQNQQNKDENKKNQKNNKQKDNKGNQRKKDQSSKNKQNKGDRKNSSKNKENKTQPKQKPGEEKGQNQNSQQNKPKPRKGQLTPQQVKQILVALKNKEQKTQKKIKAKILKGSSKKNKQDKDW